MRWRKYFERARRSEDLAQEIAHHIAQETDDNIARGMRAEEARLAAVRKFGSRTAVREDVHAMNTIGWLDLLARDLKHGLRQMRLGPGFALAAVISLALGIGANTAIFTLVDQIVLRLLPVERPRELVRIRADGIRPGGNWGDDRYTFPYPTYVALRDRNTVFAGLTGSRVESVTLLDDDRTDLVTAAMVAGNYFQVLGVRAHLGRTLVPDDDRDLNGHPVAVLQYDFWRSRYQARRDIVGTSIRINGAPFTVVGVAAPGFEGTNVGFPTKIFVPVAMQPTVAPTNPARDDERQAWFYLFARLKPGVAVEQAETAMRVLYRQRQQEELSQPYFGRFPETRELYLRHVFALDPADRGDSSLRSRLERPLVILEGLAAAVLLIACANIAGLLLARGAARHRDLAIRRAIGASRSRIVGQLFAESALLSVVGAAGGLLIGTWLTRGLLALLPVATNDLSISATPDVRVFAFTITVTAVTAVLFGLLPAWKTSQVAPVAILRDESGSIAGGRGHIRLRKAFVAMQVGLSAVLLFGAGLFARSLMNLQRVDLGMDSDNVVTFAVRPAIPYDGPRRIQAYRAIVEGLSHVPGVVAIGANRTPLFTGGRTDATITIRGYRGEGAEPPFSFINAVTPGYFEALRIPITSGSPFNWRDWGSGRRLAVVNEAFRRAYFTSTPPLGGMIGIGPKAEPDNEIVGVSANARYDDVRGPMPNQIFRNLDSVIDRVNRIQVYARTSGDPRQLMAAIPAEVHRIDQNFVVSGMRTLDEQIGTQTSTERMLSFLSLAFAAVATVLAIVGLHGVLAFQVVRRTREIGVRVALGAGRGVILRLVAREMALVALGGVAGGMTTGYAGARFVENQLFGVNAGDPLVLGLTVAALLCAGLAATLIPALRAAFIDPARALRYE